MRRRIRIDPEGKLAADRFGQFAGITSTWLGSKWGFLCAGLAIVAWALTGPIFHYSELWQLIVNTGTDIVTFLMVFLIQNTQNRDARAINLKLDELIRAVDKARNHMINIERLSGWPPAEETPTPRRPTAFRSYLDQRELPRLKSWRTQGS